MTEPQPYDHVLAGEDAPVPGGIYRVVGTGDEIALLRVGDADGRRETTGAVVQVSRSTYAEFETAPNPDSGVSVGQLLPPLRTWASAVRYWLPF
jgi:hypothetical protein